MATSKEVSRRSVLFTVPALAGMFSHAASQQTAPQPNANRLQQGHLIFPMKRNACAFLSTGVPSEQIADEATWRRELDEFLEATDAPTTEVERSNLAWLRSLSYKGFLSHFHGDALPVSAPLSMRSPTVGHVAIVEKDEKGDIFVIEAQTSLRSPSLPGVQRLKWSDWLAPRSDDYIWLAKVRDVDGSGIVAAAKKQIGKPYSIAPWNLMSDKSFYCSKLIWHAVNIAGNISVDNISPSNRFNWITPSAILESVKVDRLHQPAQFRCNQ